MKNGINKAFFVGAVATQPELRYSSGGLAILELTLAGRSPVVTDDDEIKDLAFYQRVKAFGTFAEALAEQFSPGQVVAVDGRLDFRFWESEKGRRSSVEVVIETINTLNPEVFTLETDSRSQPILVEGTNEVTLGGNLTKDAHLRYLPTGTAVATLAIAVNERIGKDERVGFHRIEAWRAQAEAIADASKGEGVIVKGRLVNESWNDKDGTKQFSTKVEATRVLAVASKTERAAASPPQVESEEESLPF